MGNREIHFYAGGEFMDDFDVMNMTSLTHYGFRKDYNRLNPVIRTTSMVDLSFDLLDEGWYDKIFLHENGKILEMYPGMITPGGKEIRKHHNIQKLWMAGVWDDYFYPELSDKKKKWEINLERLDIEL